MMDVADAVRKAGASIGYDQLKDEQVKALCTFVEGRDVFVSSSCLLALGRACAMCSFLLFLTA